MEKHVEKPNEQKKETSAALWGYGISPRLNILFRSNAQSISLNICYSRNFYVSTWFLESGRNLYKRVLSFGTYGRVEYFII